jgi:hypothetical protein
LSLTVLAIAFLAFPSRNYDHDKLRQSYADHLRSYEGTRYVWGGENILGVDCSGLVRTALIKASFQQGIVTANPGLVRFSLSLWWHDSTAKALGEEYRNQTEHVLNAKRSMNLGKTRLHPVTLPLPIAASTFSPVWEMMSGLKLIRISRKW